MSGQAVVTIRDKQWTCSVASTPAELTAGLSGVPSLAPGTGMLFILPQEQIVTVTAEDMRFPLSIIFISDNLRVTEVELLLTPGDSDTTNLPCRYFLEVNPGEVDDINPGDEVNIQITQAPGTTNWMTPVMTFAGVVIAGAFMAKVSKTMADAVFRKAKARPILYGPSGELLTLTSKPGVIPPEPRRRHRPEPGRLEFLPDSPEFLAYTIDDIGYRSKIDAAFLQAIARARRQR